MSDSIPIGWELVRLGEVAEGFSGGTPSRSNPAFFNGDIPWIKSGELNSGRITYTEEKITEEAVRNSSVKYIGEGTLLYAMYGATAGVPAISEIQATINQAIFAILPKKWLDHGFLYYYLFFNRGRIVQKYTQGGQPNLSGNLIKGFQIPLPPLPEQRKIAEILSTWDEAISHTEALIAALELRKKGLMQRLLTGEVRFPGFEEEWREIRLGEVFKLVKRKNVVGTKRVLTASGEYGLIDQVEFFNKSVAGKDLSKYYLLKKGEFAYNRSSMTGYPYGAIKRQDRYSEGALSTLYICFELEDKARADSDFYRFYFEAGILNRQLSMITQVGARAHGLLNISNTDFMNVKIALPEFDEQKAISKVLNLAELQVISQKQQLELLQRQKKGLMQRLLTGEVRV